MRYVEYAAIALSFVVGFGMLGAAAYFGYKIYKNGRV